MALDTLNLKYFRWLLNHVTDVPALLDAGERVLNADGLDARWQAIKDLGDLVVNIAHDFPVVMAMEDVTSESLEAEVTAQGLDLSRLRNLWPVFEKLLPLILPILLHQSDV